LIDAVNSLRRSRARESCEPQLLGSAGTIHANREFVSDADDCLIIYADNLSDVRLGEMIHFHRSHGDAFTMMLFRAPCPAQCGIAELDASGRVMAFTEKPQAPRSDLANAGVYVVSADNPLPTVSLNSPSRSSNVPRLR
jgi:mannose-1-phosphate guanylyltransferase